MPPIDLKENNIESPVEGIVDRTVQPFKVGQGKTIKGFFNSQGTTDKDTLMLMANYLGAD